MIKMKLKITNWDLIRIKLVKMSGKLLLKVTANAKNNIVRQIALDSSKYGKRDVIAIDVYDDVPDVATHTGQVSY